MPQLDLGQVAATINGKTAVEIAAGNGLSLLQSGSTLTISEYTLPAGAKKLYVDAYTGDDSNPGTQKLPFRTIQAAIGSLPKNLNKTGVVINIGAGIYNELITISGFYGGSAYLPLTLIGSSSLDETRQIGAIAVANNSALVRLEGLCCSMVTDGDNSSSEIGISASACRLYNVKVKKAGQKTYGVFVGSNAPAQAHLSNVEVDGFNIGVFSSYASYAAIYKLTAKNCVTGVAASYGMVSGSSFTYEGNTTDTSQLGGGRIFFPE